MTGETMRSRNPAGRSGFLNNLLAFVNTLAAFIESRLSLFAKESKAAFGQLLGLLAWLVGALLFFALGYGFLIVGVIAGIAHLLEVPWLWVALGAAGVHFVLVLIFLLGARGIMKRAPFRELGAELKKDREWLKNLDETTTPRD
jgi:uncharacterized membrane protein YqjE